MRPPSGLAPPRRSREPGRYRMRARAPSCRCTSKATSSQLASPDGSNRWTRRGAALRRAAPFEPQRATDAFCGSTLLLNATRTHQHTLFVEFKKMVAARLETGQQALLQEITVRVAPRLALLARSRMTALPLSQSRHVMTEDEAAKCSSKARTRNSARGGRARARRARCRVRAPPHAMARLPRHGRFAEHQSDQRRASDHAARDSQLLQGRKAVPRAREPGRGREAKARRPASVHERARARALQVSDQVAKAHSIRSQSWCATEPLGSASRALLTRTPPRARACPQGD